MKFLIGLGIFVVAVIVLVLIIALFVKKDYHVEREIVINKPKTQVFDYIKMLRNQTSYNKWAMKDPAMKTDYRGTDGTVGAVSAWEGNGDAGKGEQEIKKIAEGERIDLELRFEKPMEAVSTAYMTTSAAGDAQTTVTWGMDGHMSYPFNAMLLFMNMEKMLGNDMQTSLTTLKSIQESTL